jgi:hypothetical protein
LADLLSDQQSPVDGVICCTPTDTHASVVQQSADMGIEKGLFAGKSVVNLLPEYKHCLELLMIPTWNSAVTAALIHPIRVYLKPSVLAPLEDL